MLRRSPRGGDTAASGEIFLPDKRRRGLGFVGRSPQVGDALNGNRHRGGYGKRGITLLKGDLHGVEQAIRLSRATMSNIRQNLFFAFIYNAAGVPLAAGLLYPVFGVLLSSMIAGLAMSLSSVSVITNALRLRSLRLN